MAWHAYVLHIHSFVYLVACLRPQQSLDDCGQPPCASSVSQLRSDVSSSLTNDSANQPQQLTAVKAEDPLPVADVKGPVNPTSSSTNDSASHSQQSTPIKAEDPLPSNDFDDPVDPTPAEEGKGNEIAPTGKFVDRDEALANALQELAPIECATTWTCTTRASAKTGLSHISEVCTLPGVVCGPNGPTSIVLKRIKAPGRPIPASLFEIGSLEVLKLKDMNLTGKLPEGLAKLTRLHTLWLSKNKLTGSISTQFDGLTALQEVRIFSNKFEGTIPSIFNTMQDLEVLKLGGNHLHGTIPQKLFNLPRLRTVMIGDNRLTGELHFDPEKKHELSKVDACNNLLTGPIAAELFLSPFLTDVKLDNNKLTGGIPSTFGDSKVLVLSVANNRLSGDIHDLKFPEDLMNLDISNNSFTGQFPNGICSSSKLGKLNMAYNRIDGRISDEVGQLSELKFLNLTVNALEGTIPESVGSLSRLEHLDLSGNELIGQIPYLANLKKLGALLLGGNHLTGTVPSWLPELSDLWIVRLQDNGLRGTIPSSLGSMSNLMGLDLGDNWLVGSIPPELGNLTNLKGFSVSRNGLGGVIPSELGNLPNLSFLLLHENKLGGALPRLHLRPQPHDPEQQMVLTVFSNRLSCHVPRPGPLNETEFRPMTGVRGHMHLYMALGNEFCVGSFDKEDDGGVKWNDADVSMMRRKELGPVVLGTLASVLFYLFVVLWVVKWDVKYLFSELFLGAWQDTSLEVAGHLWLLKALFVLCLPSICALLPVYWYGANYTECGDQLGNLSIAYFKPLNDLFHGIAPASWTLFLILVGYLTTTLPKQQKQEQAALVVVAERKAMFYISWIVWLALVAVFSLAPAAYAFAKSLPQQNTLHAKAEWLIEKFMSPEQAAEQGWNLLVTFVLPLISTCASLVMPVVAVKFADITGLHVQVLQAVGQVAIIWMVPIIVTVYLDDDCMRRTRLFWNDCEHDELPFSFWLEGKSGRVEFLPNKEEWCGVPQQLQLRGGCMRSTVRALSPLVLFRLVFQVGVLPLVFVMTWLLSNKAEDGLLYDRFTGRLATSFGYVDYFAYLNVWAAIAISWGALVPLFLPLLILATAVSLMNLRLETCVFKREPRKDLEGDHVSRSLLICMAIQFIVFLALFIMETGNFCPRWLTKWLVQMEIVLRSDQTLFS